MRKKIAVLICCCLLSSALYAGSSDSLTFAQAANLAVAASVDLEHARSSHALAEGAWKWGLRSYFPQMNVTVSENDRLQQYGADTFMKNYGFNIEQMVWDGGRVSMSRKLERMELDLSSKRMDKMANEVAESAISAYRTILTSRAILNIKKEMLIVLEEQLRILNEEVQLGLALPVDLASANLSLYDAKLDINSLQLDLAEMEKQFAELLGLETLPVLAEKVDVNRSVSFSLQNILPAASMAASLAKEQNPDLVEARYLITKKQMELKYVSRSWIPNLRLTGNFGLTGQHYPLTRYNYSVGISIDFLNPWFQNRLGAQTGWEPLSPGVYDRTAMLQNSFSPLPDPSSAYGKKQAALSLALEQEKYNIILEKIGRIASNAVEKCALAEKKRLLAHEAAALGVERCLIEETRLSLGHITRLKLMETLIEQTQREIAVVEAATALLEAERELERFLDLQPGELFKLRSML